MRSVGWRPSFSWCAIWLKLITLKALKKAEYPQTQIDFIQKLFNPNSQQTYKNFDKVGLTSDEPEVGYGAIYKYKGCSGHTVLIESVDDGLFGTYEGNSGDKVSHKHHLLNDYQLMGFLKLILDNNVYK